jgi:hypothetical protein
MFQNIYDSEVLMGQLERKDVTHEAPAAKKHYCH